LLKSAAAAASKDENQSNSISSSADDRGAAAAAGLWRIRRSLRGRRHSLSVTQDLASLAEMIHGDSNRRRLNRVMSFLDEAGKRSAASDADEYDDDVDAQQLRQQILGSAMRRLKAA
jgi:hypothetical protein